jgi:hypothetical protein
VSVSIIDTKALQNVSKIDTKLGMEPARTIISRLGGPTKVAGIAGVHRTRVSNWARRKKDGGTGGLIPFKHVPALLAAAKRQGVELSADDFLPVPENVA